MKTKTGRRAIIVTLCALLLVGASVLGTVAYLTATTAARENTFTYGDIGLTLDESTGASYKIVPGVDIDKDRSDDRADVFRPQGRQDHCEHGYYECPDRRADGRQQDPEAQVHGLCCAAGRG